jgi:ribosomal protein L11 methyltransferase
VTLYKKGTPATLRASEAEIRKGLLELEQFGLDTGAGEIRVARVKAEDWAESWKKHFKKIEIGSRILIKPSWDKQRPKKGQALVILDPGLSFGTGQHATTSFCLRQIAAYKPEGRTRAMLDMGCGSGILAISAAKLGYAPVKAFDFDPISVRVAKKNSRINRVDKKIAITEKDLTKLPLKSAEKFGLVCANLISPLLIAERKKIIQRVAPGGLLVLAGILDSEFDQVRSAYEGEGLQLIKSKAEREWKSGAFKSCS